MDAWDADLGRGQNEVENKRLKDPFRADCGC